MSIKIFLDGGDLETILDLCQRYPIDGITTNPSIMRKAGIKDYATFGKELLFHIQDLPVSFEVFADTWIEMERQANVIAGWGENVYVKIPPMTTNGMSTRGLITSLTNGGIKVNATCIFSYEQIDTAIKVLGNRESIISIFAGRIMDAGIDARGFVQYASYNKLPEQEILWASTREVWNIKMAEEAGADIITLSPDLIKKMDMAGMGLNSLCLDTVKMFRKDAVESGYTL